MRCEGAARGEEAGVARVWLQGAAFGRRPGARGGSPAPGGGARVRPWPRRRGVRGGSSRRARSAPAGPSRERGGGGRWSSATVKRLPARREQAGRAPSSRAPTASRLVPPAENGLSGGTLAAGQARRVAGALLGGAWLSSGVRVRAAAPALAPGRGHFLSDEPRPASRRRRRRPAASTGLQYCRQPPVQYLSGTGSSRQSL